MNREYSINLVDDFYSCNDSNSLYIVSVCIHALCL